MFVHEDVTEDVELWEKRGARAVSARRAARERWADGVPLSSVRGAA